MHVFSFWRFIPDQGNTEHFCERPWVCPSRVSINLPITLCLDPYMLKENRSVGEFCRLWSLGMDQLFHPPLYWACDYLSMLEKKLNHKNKERHIADTIVSWPNPRQWVIVHVSKGAPDRKCTGICCALPCCVYVMNPWYAILPMSFRVASLVTVPVTNH